MMPIDTTSFPFDTVVRITDIIGGVDLQGSGVLIAPDEVLTASHVVWSSTSGLASDVTVAPGFNAGSEPFGTATGTFVHFDPVQDAQDKITEQQSQLDYAVIHLSKPFGALGTMGMQANFSGGPVNVTGYPKSLNGLVENSQQSVTLDPSDTLLDGTAIGPGSSGGPVWIASGNGSPLVVGLVSAATGGIGSPGFFTQITTAAFDQIETWVALDDSGVSASLSALDTTTGQAAIGSLQPYTGPVAGLQDQFIDVTTDNLDISVSTPNWFLHSGGGTDAIAASSGTNVLDGGTGSNFLTGGTGMDTFFVDDRVATSDTWSTVVGFHAGDSATVWGVTPQDFSLDFQDGQGAAGFTGLTLHASASGMPTASLTLAGLAQADMASGRLAISFGTDPASGSAFMLIHASS